MKRLLRVLAPLALVAAPLAAQDAHFGIQAGVNFPQSDLKDFIDNKLGFTLGANVAFDLGSGHVIRPRADYGYYSASVSDPFFTSDNKAKTLFVGADYLYFPAQRMEGFYVTGGLGYQNTKVESSTPFGDVSDSKGAFAWAVGGGWQITDLVGAELRYTSSHPKFDGGTFKSDAINVGVTFKF
ncbi:MAG TPA: outer membrane beta-barrel protein [Holophagaceae bacterium]|nr:outer membrane beta-barrel protein [Holophagaceae bacterium]